MSQQINLSVIKSSCHLYFTEDMGILCLSRLTVYLVLETEEIALNQVVKALLKYSNYIIVLSTFL